MVWVGLGPKMAYEFEIGCSATFRQAGSQGEAPACKHTNWMGFTSFLVDILGDTTILKRNWLPFSCICRVE